MRIFLKKSQKSQKWDGQITARKLRIILICILKNMHSEILTAEQNQLLPLLESFAKDFYLVGGTAIALQLGHRRSVDFDLFTEKPVRNQSILNNILKSFKINSTLVSRLDELTLMINKVKITFFRYPYAISCPKEFGYKLKMPDILTLAAMKAYALGRRAKWKDYVDLYFVMKDFFCLGEIADKAKKIFGNEFNEKIFRAQLCYFKDVDFSEKIDYLKGFAVSDAVIKRRLKEFSVEKG